MASSANANAINHYIAMRMNLEKKFQNQLSNPDNLKVADKTYGNMMQRYQTALGPNNHTAIGETPVQGSEEFLTMFPPRGPPLKRARPATKGGKGKKTRRANKTKRATKSTKARKARK